VRRILIVLGILVAFDAILLAVDLSPSGPTSSGIRVGLVFDVGGRGDKSFNDQAYAGLIRARDEIGVGIEYIEPGEGADRESALRMLAAAGFDLVVGVGFIFTDDVALVAREYPDQAFACVDYAIQTDGAGRPIPPPKNVAAIKFREEEGSYLVGAIAALVSRTRTIGFVGGMDIPLIRRFEAGYRAGAARVCPRCRVAVNYAGVTGAAFKDPGKGKELALAQYRGGADVIFHASGSTGLGVFEAARETGNLAIGVDSDQYHEAPGFILTSMMKRVDVAVYDTIREVAQGRFEGGIRSFGLTEDGVGYVFDDHNRDRISAHVREQVELLRTSIVSGGIRVPTSPRE
jgi:basic membrane protein A